MRRRCCLLLLMIACSTSSGCGLTLGPRSETRFVIVRPGRPLEILENRSLRGRRLEDDSIGAQDVGGWVAMPREHFDALKRAAELGAAVAP